MAAEEEGGLLDRDLGVEVLPGGGPEAGEEGHPGRHCVGGPILGEGLVLPFGVLDERGKPHRKPGGIARIVHRIVRMHRLLGRLLHC